MNILYNAPEMKERRRELRKNMTHAERMLWERLRGRRFQGLRFLRQYGVDRFILDFYCPALRIAIEVDGVSHLGDGAVRDSERDAIIETHHIWIFRVWNQDVFFGMDQVLARLADFIHNVSLEHKGE